MERLDKRAPFTATGGIIPPEFQNIKTPCYILDEKALIENAKLLGEVACLLYTSDAADEL